MDIGHGHDACELAYWDTTPNMMCDDLQATGDADVDATCWEDDSL